MKAYVGVVRQLRVQHQWPTFSKRYQERTHPSAPLFLFEGDREGTSHLLTQKLDYYGKS
ncbi:MAG: hypothetical protein OEM58_05605 [Nitrospirota bacterium]|nr:hypothetical protein [Nitrospirota bacterium]